MNQMKNKDIFEVLSKGDRKKLHMILYVMEGWWHNEASGAESEILELIDDLKEYFKDDEKVIKNGVVQYYG